MDSFWQRLKQLDVYPKTMEDFTVKTASGAIVSVVSCCFIFYLFVSELSLYLTPIRATELVVDTTRGLKLQINLNVTFPHMACSMISLDAMDISGEQQLDVYHHVFKRRVDQQGQAIAEEKAESLGDTGIHPEGKPIDENYCGSCYGAEETPGQCCNTCEEVRNSYRKKGWMLSTFLGDVEQCKREGFLDQLTRQVGEGCNIFGYLEVNKVAGNFHFAPGKSFQQAHMHVHDLMPFGNDHFNLTHMIHRLSFGADYPGIVNPLDGENHIVSEKTPSPMIQYFIKVVPTVYEDASGKVINTNQFSVTDHYRSADRDGGRTLPGVFFFYDLSPIMAIHKEAYRSLAHFLTGVCAIIGGVFTVSGIIDSMVYSAQRRFKAKLALGKAG